jgi:hypothetical protein
MYAPMNCVASQYPPTKSNIMFSDFTYPHAETATTSSDHEQLPSPNMIDHVQEPDKRESGLHNTKNTSREQRVVDTLDAN